MSDVKALQEFRGVVGAGRGRGRDGMDIPGRKNRVYKGVEVGIERVGPGSGNPSLAGPVSPQQEVE